MAEPFGVPRTSDRAWMMRTYSGHSTAAASNALYKTNLAKGQTGLSIAFDLPTQTGHDPDHALATGEVGKVGVPVVHSGHMAALLDGIPLDEMNTSMTINATAPWLLALYIAQARATGVTESQLRGTTQNDLLKEFLSRGTYIFGPDDSRTLTVDMIAFCATHLPSWNPMNVCSYHLQEAGATPVQEVAFALANAVDILDAVRDSGQVESDRFDAVVASISFFVNASVRFVEETCKMRAFTQMWDRICEERYGVTDPNARRFRYGVQVNSLGLTKQQPENNLQRIVLETLGVTLSKSARARSIQLPAWNEALGLPRPWDQQWSLRIQQVLAEESDLLEFDDIFEGSHVIEARTADLVDAATAELDDIVERGGAFAAVGELKGRLVASHTERMRRIESGAQTVVGVNAYTDTEPSPLSEEGGIVEVDPAVQAELIEDVMAWRAGRDRARVDAALERLRSDVEEGHNVMPATIALAEAGGTTGEWADALRDIYGTYTAPTGVVAAGASSSELRVVARRSASLSGGPPRVLVAKPGLDGHSNGAEQIAVAARDAGMEVIYHGIRRTPDEIAAAAETEDPDVIGLSILSGSHMTVIPAVLDALALRDVDVPVVVGGIIPDADRAALTSLGIARVYTPTDFELSKLMADLVDLTESSRAAMLS
ncbi:MAG: cobalamin-dependent protein [Acidobacteria bacterium]|nr:cobalamin-dependent protein [Acidobacteriota bacterium]